MISNLCSIIKAGADEKIKAEQNNSNKYQYKANRAFIINRIKKILPKLLCDQYTCSTIHDLFEKTFKKDSQIQPSRKCERSKRPGERTHFNNRKTTT